MYLRALLTSLLVVTLAFAFPTANERFSARVARRSQRGASASIELCPACRSATVSRPKISNATHADISSNWAGVVQNSAPGTWKTVTGTFVLPPTLTPPAGESWGASTAWVGIDGDTCGTAILQTGVDFMIDNGVITYAAWYEWYPDYAYDFTGIDLSGWDSITATVVATSRTSGTATIENTSTGQTVSVDIDSPSFPLCQQDAEWIVEDFEEGGALVPFASFGWLGITSSVATSMSGAQAEPGSGTVINMEQNGVLIAAAYGSGTNVLFATGDDIGKTSL